ncbi:DUF4118 domain-containing protein [Bradyrhizobium erythrophlei]|uniref:Sensor protein KdpD transmembrane domain-containing protein n=1 Tax=Bradyrhizobium erythrophlei TaxID=1437360 RepID=A0A1M5PYN4_9BRAD|nr:DUF4118 domain-containing protein [Bradyrhizobium erythrophlei]SHH07127.1 protein of unknown function [Bradyrhizobium erythrophlei]
MKKNFEYRHYAISHLGSNFIAKSQDGDDVALVSVDVQRLIFAIDKLWDGLESGYSPAWFKQLPIHVLDLDDPAFARHFPPITETVPIGLSLIPSISYAVMALFVTLPIAFFMHRLIVASEPEVIFTLAVCTAAMGFGTVPALVLTVLSAVAYNFSIVPPVTEFSFPTVCEIVYLMINVSVSIVVPWALRKVGEHQRAAAQGRIANIS